MSEKKQRKVKICGITTAEEVGWLNECRPDYAGFVLFFSKSKRNLDISTAKKLLRQLDIAITPVAVTVKPTREQIEQIAAAGFQILQVHGEIEDELLEQAGISIWKAFNVTDLELFEKYNNMACVNGFVLDAATPGSGKTFDWELLANMPESSKLKMLAGGISLDNLQEALQIPTINGIDTSSGVEKASGVGKDEEKVREFIRIVKEW